MPFTPLLGINALTLRDITFVLTNSVGTLPMVDVTELHIEWTIRKDNRTAGGSSVEQTVLSVQNAKITAKGFNSSQLSFPDLLPGQKIATMTLNDTETTPLSILKTAFFAKFPVTGWCFGDLKTTLTDKPSDWEFEIIPNVVAGGIT